jgi:hypothetical protein
LLLPLGAFLFVARARISFFWFLKPALTEPECVRKVTRRSLKKPRVEALLTEVVRNYCKGGNLDTKVDKHGVF